MLTYHLPNLDSARWFLCAWNRCSHKLVITQATYFVYNILKSQWIIPTHTSLTNKMVVMQFAVYMVACMTNCNAICCVLIILGLYLQVHQNGWFGDHFFNGQERCIHYWWNMWCGLCPHRRGYGLLLWEQIWVRSVTSDFFRIFTS